MLYVFYGTDIGTAGKKARALIDSLRAKKPDAAFEIITADDWSPSLIENHLGGQGLFSNKYIVFVDRLSENDEAKEKLPDYIPAMNESANIFIVLEGKLNAELKKSFEKYSEKILEFEKKESLNLPKKEFNIFALGDALGARDSFKCWSIYRQAIENGLESESILGTLFWQVKSMFLAANSKTANEAGLNPFVFSKSKKYAGNYSADELKKLMTDLVVLYHDGHRGLVNMEIVTEKLLLELK